MNTDKEAVVEQLIALLTQGNAHVTFSKAIEHVPFNLLGVVPGNLPYSIWQLVEHIRFTQKDILEFSTSQAYVAPEWPAAYWPHEKGPQNEEAWKNTLTAIENDRNAFIELLTTSTDDLTTPFAHGEGQNLLREAMLIADHTAYHTGQIVLVRRMLENWG